MSVRTLAVAIALVVVAAAGCGIPTDDGPSALPPLPTPTPTPTPIAPIPTVGVIYLLDPAGLLVPVERELDPDTRAASLLAALVDGATEDETELATAVSGEIQLLGSRNQEGVLTLDLTTGLTELPSADEQRNALAQVVFTFTELATVDRIAILVEGEPLSALPTNSGDVDGTALLDRTDYPCYVRNPTDPVCRA